MANTDKFDSIANQYDTPERIKIARIAADAIREYVVAGNDLQAIDFGCGTGLVGMNLIDAFHSVTFLDTSANMLDVVQDKIEMNQIPNAHTLRIDFETNQQPDLQADYIFMAQVLLRIPDYQAVLTKLHKCLRPGGHVIIVDFDKNQHVASSMVHNGFDQTELTEVMRKIGFSKVSSKTIYTGEKLLMNQDASMFVMDGKKE